MPIGVFKMVINKNDLIFGITKSDIQMLALETLNRKLNQQELISFTKGITNYFKNWDCWIQELIINDFKK